MCEKKRTLLSLFAGAGGLDLGLEMAGFHTLAANELEPQACETLRRNKVLANLQPAEVDRFIEEALTQRSFQRLSDEDRAAFFQRIKTHDHREAYLQRANVLEGDIREIESSTFEDIVGEDLFCIAGGPPCQPFSKAGKQKSLDCTKNGDLFFEFVRLVRDLQPTWFLFENVKGITFTKTDVLYVQCSDCGKKSLAPFHVRQDLISHPEAPPCDLCGCQVTEWLSVNERGGSLKIIVNEFEKLGYRCESQVLNAADYGAPQIRERLIIVGSRDDKKFHWPSPTHAKVVNGGDQGDLFVDGKKLKPWVTMRDALWQKKHPKFGRVNSSAKLWVKNVVRPHDEPVTWEFDRPSPTIGAHQGAKLAYAPQGVPEAQLIRQQWATKGWKQGDTPPVEVEHAYLSDEELLKLQTFPAWWYLHGTRMQRAFQIGNAVPPVLAKALGAALIESDNLNDN